MIVTQRYLPSTEALHVLRMNVSSAVISVEEKDAEENGEQSKLASKDSDAQLFVALKRLRNTVLSKVSGTTPASAISSFFEAWDIFSTLHHKHLFYLPPLYKSKTLVSIMDDCLDSILSREARYVYGSNDNIGHAVLGGVEGAGKTTIMRALALGTSALLQRMIPVTHDYQDFKLPSLVITDAYNIIHSSALPPPPLISIINNETKSASHDLLVQHDNSIDNIEKNIVATPAAHMDPIELFQQHDQELLLFVDEFQHVFQFPENPHWEKGQQAAIEVHRYARLHGTYVIISGSTVDMRNLMFKSGMDDTTDIWRKRGFPDYNGSLFKFRTIPALRTTAELSSYLTIRYPLWELSTVDTSNILYLTGGIGRWVHEIWDLCRRRLEPVNGRHHLLSFEILEEKTSFRKFLPERFLEDAANRCLIVYLARCGAPTFDQTGKNLLSCGGVDRIALINALQLAGVSSPSALLDTAQDESVLYITNTDVQFSRPIDARNYHRNLPPATHRFLLLTAVHFMVKGIADDKSSNTDVNAGNALEELVRENVFSGAVINEDVVFEKSLKLVINSQGALCVSEEGNPVLIQLTEDYLRLLSKKHICWQKEHGIDGAAFSEEQDKKGKSSWFLDGWQCKGGRCDVEIGGGNGSMQTALDNYKKSYRLQDFGDKQITEILLKAQVGMVMLIKALNVSIPSIMARPRNFVITTTKRCSKSCLNTIESWKGGVTIERDVLAHFALNAKVKKALTQTFKVGVVTGCGWVIDSISSTDESGLRELAKLLLDDGKPGATSDIPTLGSSSSYCTIQ